MMKSGYRKALYLIPWTSLLGGWLLGVSSGSGSENLGLWLLLISALCFGLPHGAYDFWLLLDAARAKRNSFQNFIVLFTLYLAAVLAVVTIWQFLPGLVLGAFLVVTVWHFGSGDAVWESTSRINWLINSLSRGLLIMSAPLTFFPLESSRVLGKLDVSASEILITAAPFALVIGVFLQLLGTSVLFNRNLGTDVKKGLLLFWLETIILLLFFKVTTPLLAVTVYLLGVHSWRHLLRLDVYERSDSRPQSLGAIIYRFHLRSLPVTLFSLAGLFVIYLIQDFHPSDPSDYIPAYLVLLSALTLPHAILITWNEMRRQKMNLL